MVLQDYKIDGDYICINKAELEELRVHYHSLAMEKRGKLGYFYLGKRDICIEILKMFEPLIG